MFVRSILNDINLVLSPPANVTDQHVYLEISKRLLDDLETLEINGFTFKLENSNYFLKETISVVLGDVFAILVL